MTKCNVDIILFRNRAILDIARPSPNAPTPLPAVAAPASAAKKKQMIPVRKLAYGIHPGSTSHVAQ
ncbi:Uncharacterized protein ChrSV_1579 [Chromobacterium vaccinii]|nr:Uncharacterized protein ChrSW_1579 [Chromobacterium vaccinii]QND89037.1 Uncharacterized protein ChrSV_1579 [Chromobacterium vaccinii]